MVKVRPTKRREQSCKALVKVFPGRGSSVYEHPEEGNIWHAEETEKMNNSDRTREDSRSRQGSYHSDSGYHKVFTSF